jgi:hypothetical protein
MRAMRLGKVGKTALGLDSGPVSGYNANNRKKTKDIP